MASDDAVERFLDELGGLGVVFENRIADALIPGVQGQPDPESRAVIRKLAKRMADNVGGGLARHIAVCDFISDVYSHRDIPMGPAPPKGSEMHDAMLGLCAQLLGPVVHYHVAFACERFSGESRCSVMHSCQDWLDIDVCATGCPGNRYCLDAKGAVDRIADELGVHLVSVRARDVNSVLRMLLPRVSIEWVGTDKTQYSPAIGEDGVSYVMIRYRFGVLH